MKVTSLTKRVLNARKQSKYLKAKGYERIEGPWELDRGWRWQERIVDAVISANGKDVWVKTELPSDATRKPPPV